MTEAELRELRELATAMRYYAAWEGFHLLDIKRLIADLRRMVDDLEEGRL